MDMDNKTTYCNIPVSIQSKIGKNLHNLENHPINIVKKVILDYFSSLKGYEFEIFDDINPFVSVEDNFDKLLIPKNHVARSKSDTYYLNENTVLRTHTSAHQNELLAKGHRNFIVFGDVYRKDEIDRHHYPVFHQMEAIAQINNSNNAKTELLNVLNGLVEHLFPGCEYRVRDHHFPFTDPSFEYDVKYQGEWLEILGCGVMHKQIVANNGLDGTDFMAFGLGVDRLVMKFMEITDIRYLWSDHPRFLNQFKDGVMVKFKPFSKLPNQIKDISFWIPELKVVDGIDDETTKPIKRWLEENDFYEIVREVLGDWVESVECFDEFYHPKRKQLSKAFRITYSPMDPDMKDPALFTNKCNTLQETLRELVQKLDIELR
jgi:phenylalanyl-tRNA synthetase alpha chain